MRQRGPFCMEVGKSAGLIVALEKGKCKALEEIGRQGNRGKKMCWNHGMDIGI